jgi:hypothetical protein
MDDEIAVRCGDGGGICARAMCTGTRALRTGGRGAGLTWRSSGAVVRSRRGGGGGWGNGFFAGGGSRVGYRVVGATGCYPAGAASAVARTKLYRMVCLVNGPLV